MEKINLGKSTLKVPSIAIGCMRINSMEKDELSNYIKFCVENGLNFFDHADIYGRGECEKLFGEALKNSGIKREDIIIQSKCGIVPGKMYDFSKEYILKSVDGILERLGTDYLDVLVLHRPDALVEPEEVAEAFNILYTSGKVKYFGVSNHKPSQIELLKKYVKQDILVNQLQLSLPFSNMIASGLEVNMLTDGAYDRDGSVLDYCRLNDMTIQAWSPFQYGFFEGVFIGSEKYPELNKVLDELAEKYCVTPTGIATAWILRHPAKIQMIAGTTKISRLKEIIDGSKIKLTKEEWYRLYISAGHILP
ncbi:aldo/keto reductase [uncultured Fusobacterium sp.]|uniref:aldo/keto reductase n=1 Tax=uncultured Fusobacterium sp. TaxID=159267 RepID=UPI0025DD755A|nr:aldo/keto reductase [uncultured Fusobacterium sp.]